MDNWRGFGPTLSISQIYEATITEGESGLSADFVKVPARPLGGGCYLFRTPGELLETLGVTRLAEVRRGLRRRGHSGLRR